MAKVVVGYVYKKINDPEEKQGVGCIVLDEPLDMNFALWKIRDKLQEKFPRASYTIFPCCIALLKDCETGKRVSMCSYILECVSFLLSGAAVGLYISNLLLK